MKNTFGDEALDSEMLEQARALYRELARQLDAAIRVLQEEPKDGQAAEDCDRLAKRHQGQLSTVLKMEADLVRKSDTVSGPFAGHELDLDAARAEVCERVARLASAGTDE